MNNFFDLSLTADLLGRDFVQQAILAARSSDCWRGSSAPLW